MNVHLATYNVDYQCICIFVVHLPVYKNTDIHLQLSLWYMATCQHSRIELLTTQVYWRTNEATWILWTGKGRWNSTIASYVHSRVAIYNMNICIFSFLNFYDNNYYMYMVYKVILVIIYAIIEILKWEYRK